MPYFTTEFADVYGACPYGSGAESTGTCASTGTGSTGGTTGGGSLVNTGFIVLVVVTVACLIAFTAILVRVWRKPKKAAEPVVAEDETADESDDSQMPTQPQA